MKIGGLLEIEIPGNDLLHFQSELPKLQPLSVNRIQILLKCEHPQFHIKNCVPFTHNGFTCSDLLLFPVRSIVFGRYSEDHK